MSGIKHIGFAAVHGSDGHIIKQSIRSGAREARDAAGTFFLAGRPREGWGCAKAGGFRILKVRIEVVG